ncbi:MAG: hypothetical protein IT317_00870 [Anaerolineales bacterium]|nr:hypothetical protein [Anaerolineales bacterium]
MNTIGQTRGWRSVGLVITLLVLAGLACGGEVEPTATPLPRPTQRPQATNTSQAVEPTRRPSATPGEAEATPATTTTDKFDLEAYDHPSGAFSVLLPVGWERDEKDNSIFVTSPDSVVAIELSFVNAGKTLSAEELGSFIQSVEANWFATFPDYTAGELEEQPDGSIGVAKTLELSSGTPQTVFSYYWQDGQVVYEQDFWVDTDAYDDYVDSLLAVANSMTTDPSAGAKSNVYAIVYTFTGPNDYFEFAVPFGWTYTTDTPENMIVDTFTSPDDQTFIENVTYDDGTAVDDLSAFARQLLTEYYGLDDLEVADEVAQQDGSTRLDWSSPSRDLTGETFYETRGTAVLFLTWVVPNDLHDLYVPVWSYLLDTYAIPGAETE